jgi:hypothetical protein
MFWPLQPSLFFVLISCENMKEDYVYSVKLLLIRVSAQSAQCTCIQCSVQLAET